MKKYLLVFAMGLLLALAIVPAAFADDVNNASDLYQAIDQASENTETTITLGEDITLTQSLTVASGRNITLDLQGYTLDTGKYSISVLGTLVIKDSATEDNIKGSITGEKVYTASVISQDGGSVTVQDVSMSGAGYALQSSGGRITVLGTSDIKSTINFSANGSLIVGAENNQIDGPYVDNVVINYNTTVSAKFFDGVIHEVSGVGMFNENSEFNGTVFSQDISNNLPATKYACVKGSDGTYSVQLLTEENAVAKIGTVYYGNIKAAGSALQAGNTLVLLQDVTGKVNSRNGVLTISKPDVTIDLNGHNITSPSTGSYAIDVNISFYNPNYDNKSVVITNSAGQPAILSAATPISCYSASSNIIDIQGDILCENTSGDNIAIGNGVKLKNTPTAVALIGNGGFSAKVGEESYIFTSAGSAIAASTDKTATLLNNYTGSASISLGKDQEGTVDLNGFTYTTSAPEAINVQGSNVTLTVKNGTVHSTAQQSEESKIPCGVAVLEGAAIGGSPVPYNTISITLDDVDVIVDHGTGIDVNGLNSKVGISVTNKSSITVPDDQIGIYFPPQDSTLIIDNSSVTGGTGIAIKGGDLTVKGNSTIHGMGEKGTPSEGGTSGVFGTGDAIYLEGNYNGDVHVTVESGTIISDKGEPLHKLVSGESSDGEKVIQVKGGHFSKPVDSSYLSSELTTMLKSGANTSAPISYYTSVDEAMKNVQPGDTITTVGESQGSASTKTVKLDRADGSAVTTLNLTADTMITLPSASRTGYIFEGWRCGDKLYQAGEQVKISADMTFTAVWQQKYTGKYSYEISVAQPDNGSVAVDKYATEGETVTITATPDDGYVLDTLSVTAGGKELEVTDNGDGTYSFIMPSGKVSITAAFTEQLEEPNTDVADIFNDVVPGAWYTDAVQYAYDNSLMTGTSATTFEPNTTTTRGMIVSMLHRLEGSPAVGSAEFSDVAGGDWYADPVAWAASEGIVGGYGDGTFGPNDPITREQMASILYRYADYKGLDVSARASLDAYSDADSVSPWASDVMSWAVSEGIISGMTEDTLAPQGTATRAQVAAMFQRFLENVMA